MLYEFSSLERKSFRTIMEDGLAPTIFYSWQSDTNSETNHVFIKKCLEAAVQLLEDQGAVEEAPRLDHDMKGIYGDEDIFQTILDKIRECDIFVADITIVAITKAGKCVPNPNVLLELGYALNCVGPKRTIKIMNTAYDKPDGLPFDMAHKRWPCHYELKETSTELKRKNMIPKIASELAEIIQGMLGAARLKQPVFNEIAPAWKSSCFINGNDLGIYRHHVLDNPMAIPWQNGPQCFLRVIPQQGLKDMTTGKLLGYIKTYAENRLLPFGQCFNPSELTNEWGAAVFDLRQLGEPTLKLSQLFESGEIWGIESLSDHDKTTRNLTFPNTMHSFITGLENYLSFLFNRLKLLPPVKIIAGVSGVKDFSLFYSMHPADKKGYCPKDEILHEQVLTQTSQSAKVVLEPFFQKIWEEFGLPGQRWQSP